MRVLGIDPGVNGACGIVSESAQYIESFEISTVLANKSSNRQMVNAYALAADLRRVLVVTPHADIVAVIENVNSMPGQGVASTFAFGKAYGVIIGVLAALGISTEVISPAVWKKYYGIDGKNKEQARELATRLFPQASLPRKKDHNRAEALLIARYWAITR